MENLTQNISDPSIIDYFPVESSPVSVTVALLILIIGIFGNFFGVLAFLCSPLGKRPLVVDRMVGILCFVGLTTTLVCAPMHLFAYFTEVYPKNSSLCQLQGLLLNLLCLVSLWYSAVLATERFFRIASPHEHRLTFSPLNLNVILAGVFVLLLVEASGPIYGWAEYGYLNDTSVCLLNPEAKHIFTYSVIHVTCYIALPILVTVGTTGFLIRKAIHCNARLCNGSQVFRTPKSMVIIGLAILTSMLLLVPYHVILLLQAMVIPIAPLHRVAGYWLHIIAITCIYPLIIFTVGAREVFASLYFFLKEVRDWHSEGDRDSLSPAMNSTELRKSNLNSSKDSFGRATEKSTKAAVTETSLTCGAKFDDGVDGSLPTTNL